MIILLLTISSALHIIQITDEKVSQELALQLDIEFSKKELKQGEYIKITFSNINNYNLKIETSLAESVNNEIYFLGNKAYAYIPVAISKPIGSYNVKVFNNNDLVEEHEVLVVEEDFKIQNLTISEQVVKQTHNAEAQRLYQAAIKKAKSYNFKGKFFEDKFIMPAEGKITTEFGVKRYVNKSASPTRHYGIDIANVTGTLIKAPASGIVTYAGFLPSAGNYIIIDHGMGLLSYYAHLDSFGVKEQETVKQGQTIGYMGTTGFSTGPHLHFALTFRNVYTNPWQFIERETTNQQ